MWAGGRQVRFKAEINQAFQVLETRLPLTDSILAHNTFRSPYSFVPDSFWGWEIHRCCFRLGIFPSKNYAKYYNHGK